MVISDYEVIPIQNSTVLELSGKFSFELILFFIILTISLLLIQVNGHRKSFHTLINLIIKLVSYSTLFLYSIFFILNEIAGLSRFLIFEKIINSYFYFIIMIIFNIVNWSTNNRVKKRKYYFNNKIEMIVNRYGHVSVIILLFLVLRQFSLSFDSILASDLKLFPNNNFENFKLFSMSWQFYPFMGGVYPLEKGSFYLNLIENILNYFFLPP